MIATCRRSRSTVTPRRAAASSLLVNGNATHRGRPASAWPSQTSTQVDLLGVQYQPAPLEWCRRAAVAWSRRGETRPLPPPPGPRPPPPECPVLWGGVSCAPDRSSGRRVPRRHRRAGREWHHCGGAGAWRTASPWASSPPRTVADRLAVMFAAPPFPPTVVVTCRPRDLSLILMAAAAEGFAGANFRAIGAEGRLLSPAGRGCASFFFCQLVQFNKVRIRPAGLAGHKAREVARALQ